jgi:hypothetical protein
MFTEFSLDDNVDRIWYIPQWVLSLSRLVAKIRHSYLLWSQGRRLHRSFGPKKRGPQHDRDVG